MKNGNHQADYVLAACGIVPVVWLALLAAPDLSGGLFAVIERFPKAIGHPFHITICADSIKTVIVSLLAYGLGIGIYCSTRMAPPSGGMPRQSIKNTVSGNLGQTS